MISETAHQIILRLKVTEAALPRMKKTSMDLVYNSFKKQTHMMAMIHSHYFLYFTTGLCD